MKGLPLVCMLLVGASLFGTTASAMAQPRIGACAADIKKYCADIQPGEGRISACVKEHFNDLSDACKVRLASGGAAARPFAMFCRRRAARLPEKEEAAPKDPAVSCSNTSRAVAFIQRNNAAISRRLAIASAA